MDLDEMEAEYEAQEAEKRKKDAERKSTLETNETRHRGANFLSDGFMEFADFEDYMNYGMGAGRHRDYYGFPLKPYRDRHDL